MSGYRIEDFQPHVGEAFVLGEGDATLDLVLDDVEELPMTIREEGCFRLEFRGPQAPILPQAIYRLANGGREFDIFIVPLGQEGGATTYEAIFN